MLSSSITLKRDFIFQASIRKASYYLCSLIVYNENQNAENRISVMKKVAKQQRT